MMETLKKEQVQDSNPDKSEAQKAAETPSDNLVDTNTLSETLPQLPPRNSLPVFGTFNSAATQMTSVFSSVSSSVTKSLAKVAQFAGETIGTAEKTDLSEEYLNLEKQFDKTKAVYENLVRVGTSFIQPGPLTDIKLSVAEVVDKVSSTVQTDDLHLSEKLRTVNPPQTSASQSLGAHFVKSGVILGEDVPIGAALIKVGDAQDKLGKAKVQSNMEIYEKFVKPIDRLLDGPIKLAMLARRGVQNARLHLDTCKARSKSSKPEGVTQVQQELNDAQLHLDAAIDEAIRLMRTVLDSNDSLTALADFTQAMLTYYQSGFKLLEELAPEIDAMKVAQESK